MADDEKSHPPRDPSGSHEADDKPDPDRPLEEYTDEPIESEESDDPSDSG